MEVLVLASISSVGITLMMVKFLGLRNMLEFELFIDLFWTSGLAYVYHQTFSGMTLGLLTGVFISIQLWILRSVFPNKKNEIMNTENNSTEEQIKQKGKL